MSTFTSKSVSSLEEEKLPQIPQISTIPKYEEHEKREKRERFPLEEKIEIPALRDIIEKYSFEYPNVTKFLKDNRMVTNFLSEMCPNIYFNMAKILYNSIGERIDDLQYNGELNDVSPEEQRNIIVANISCHVSEPFSYLIPDIFGGDSKWTRITEALQNYFETDNKELEFKLYDAFSKDKKLFEKKNSGY